MAVAETPPLTIDFQAIPGCTDRSLTHLEGSCGSARVTGSGSLKRIQRWWGPSDPLPSEVSFADWGPVPARAGSGGSFEGRALPVSVFRMLFPERDSECRPAVTVYGDLLAARGMESVVETYRVFGAILLNRKSPQAGARK